jgi:NAD(P)H-dependent FMN reductase
LQQKYAVCTLISPTGIRIAAIILLLDFSASMMIRIISSSVRVGRKSPRLALYFKNYINKNGLGEAEILDLADFDFPIFEERLRLQENPLPEALEFADKINSADGILIVTPEYNGSIPASLKNAIDLLGPEWKHRPVALCTVSAGVFGGSQALVALQFSLWKLGALTVPAMFPVPEVEKHFDEKGRALRPEETDKQAQSFLKELLFFIAALSKMKEKF